ncbi:MAG: IS110 family transposase [Candidatus Peribacteria bacterium]|nr:IS110 family transposase [Candidatus Peribacteria bacterium]
MDNRVENPRYRVLHHILSFTIIAMTVTHFNQLTDVQSVGLDVCKASIRVCVLTRGQNLDYEIKNNLQDIQQFCKECCVPQMENIPLIVESTGDYHLLLTLELKKH